MRSNFWTDYPFKRLGDTEGEIAPVRPCKLREYDGNLYCKIKVGRFVEEIKRGYIYTKKGRHGEVPSLTLVIAQKYEKTKGN